MNTQPERGRLAVTGAEGSANNPAAKQNADILSSGLP